MLFKMPFSSKMCGCCTFQSGSICVAALSALLAAVGLVMMGIADRQIESSENPGFRMGTYGMLKAVIVSVITFFFIVFLLSILSIVGSINRKPNYVFPFVCLSFVFNIFSVTHGVGLMASLCMNVPYVPIQVVLITLLVIISVIAIQIGLWLVVYRFYQQLVAEQYGHVAVKVKGTLVYSEQPPYGHDV